MTEPLKGLYDPHIPATNQICEANQAVALSSLIVLSGTVALAQSQQMEEKLMTLKENQAANNQKLAQYTGRKPKPSASRAA